MGSMMSQQRHSNYRKAHDPWSPQFRALVHATLCAWVCTQSQRTLLELTQTDPLPQIQVCHRMPCNITALQQQHDCFCWPMLRTCVALNRQSFLSHSRPLHICCSAPTSLLHPMRLMI